MGLEPTTSCLEGRCSNQLCNARIMNYALWAGRDLNPQSQLRQQIYSLSRYQLRFTYPDLNDVKLSRICGARTRQQEVSSLPARHLALYTHIRLITPDVCPLFLFRRHVCRLLILKSDLCHPAGTRTRIARVRVWLPNQLEDGMKY